MKLVNTIRGELFPLRLWALSICCVASALACSFSVAQEETASLVESAKQSPAVAAILEMPRDEPGDTLTAVLTLLDLGEPAIAAELFKPLAQEKLTSAQQAAIVRQHGTARLLSLARTENLAGAREFAETCLEAAATEAAKPEHLTQLIADLTSDSPATRAAARIDLAATGLPAAEACLNQLASATEKEKRAALMLVLAEMRPLVNPLVIAGLAEGRGQFRRDMVELAGHLQLLDAVPWLATLAVGGDSEVQVVAAAQGALLKMDLRMPNPADAFVTVKRELERLEAGISSDPFTGETNSWWSFDPAKKSILRLELAADVRKSLARARLSQIFLALPNASTTDRQLAILSGIEAAHVGGQTASPEIMQLAESLPSSELSAALAQALEKNYPGGAIACAKLLGKRAEIEALVGHSVTSPLARGVAHPNPDVQFAALEAIQAIHPRASFPGASQVPVALWNFAAGAGNLQAIVGAPDGPHADDWAGGLRELGYDATPTFAGIELVRAAIAAPRIALILVDSDIGRPLLREVLYQLRSQPRLAHTPIAVLCGGEDLALGEKLDAADPYLLSTARPHNPEAMKSLVDRLNTLADSQPTAEVRAKRAKQALEWIGQLLGEGGPYDELLRGSELLEQIVYDPQFTEISLRALAAAGTAGSQRTLAEIASLHTQSIKIRQAAAEGFATSCERFGCLLTAAEIAQQYDRYNASETADADTQAVLGKLLDAIEHKSSNHK